MYSGARTGAKYFKLLWWACFVFIVSNFRISNIFHFLFTAGFSQVDIFQVKLMSLFAIIDSRCNIWGSYQLIIYILWKV